MTAESGSSDLPHNVVALRGAYDLSRASELREQLASFLDAQLPLVIDLGEAVYLDAVTLGVIVEAVRRGHHDERPVLIYLPETTGAPVHDLFRLTGLDVALPIVRDRPGPGAATDPPTFGEPS